MTHARKAQGRDLTSGSLHRAIWYLAPPMIFESGILNVAQVLDTYWVGQLGSAALKGVTMSITIRWVLNSLANGLGIGGMAVVARRIGAKEHSAAEHAVWQTILLGVIMSLLLSLAGMVLARPLLNLLGADAEVLPLSLAYLRISFAGISTLVLVFAINAMLRGAGEAGAAMRVLFLTTGVTVVLEPVLIRGWGPLPAMGVAGSALAFVLGYGVGLVMQVAILTRGRARIRVNLHDLKPDVPLMARIIRIALPSTIQMTLRSSSRLIIIALVGVYGTFATAGYGVANRLLLVALIPCFGMGNAAGTLVGQNLGASQPDRAERSAWWASAYTAGYMAAAALLLTVFAPSLIAIFDPTPEVVAIGTECVRIVAWSMIASAGGGGAGPWFRWCWQYRTGHEHQSAYPVGDGASPGLRPISLAGIGTDRCLVGTGHRQPGQWAALCHLVPPRQMEGERGLGGGRHGVVPMSCETRVTCRMHHRIGWGIIYTSL